jgi:hypothetical protein
MRKRHLLILGVTLLIMGAVAFWLRSHAHRVPDRDYFLEVVSPADRVVIRPTVRLEGTQYDVPPLEIRGTENVADLLEQIDWHAPPVSASGVLLRKVSVTTFRCGCDGDYHIDFYCGDQCLASLGYHHTRPSAGVMVPGTPMCG